MGNWQVVMDCVYKTADKIIFIIVFLFGNVANGTAVNIFILQYRFYPQGQGGQFFCIL